MFDVIIFGGGGAKAYQSAVVAQYLKEKYSPKAYAGISAGSIIALATALGKNILPYMLYAEGSNIYNKFPFEKNGKLKPVNLLMNNLFSKKKLTLDPLKRQIQDLISKEDFDNLSIPVFVACTCLETQTSKLFNLKDYDYNEAIDIVLASCTIPGLSNPIKIGNKHYVDGGFTKAIPLLPIDYETVLYISNRTKGDYSQSSLGEDLSTIINSIFLSNIMSDLDYLQSKNKFVEIFETGASQSDFDYTTKDPFLVNQRILARWPFNPYN